MIDGGSYHIEIADRLATIYIVGDISTATQRLIGACDALPPAVDVLCVDVNGMHQMEQRELAVIDVVGRHWQKTRRGSLRVAFALGNWNRRASYEVGLRT